MNSKNQFLPDYAIEKLLNAHYGIAGRHSAVQICQWTKKALRGTSVCYKQKFYGIDCHRCMEFSPAVLWCNQKCVYCWRPSEFMKKLEVKEDEVDLPEKILSEAFSARKKLLSGFGGNELVNKKKFSEANIPSHFAISLSGEPLMYPKLGELIKLLKNRKETKSIFVVSNGELPEMLEKLKKQKALPTQLYISIHSPNKKLFQKIAKPLYKDGWKRLQKTLKIFKKLNCRKVLRLTLIKGLNDFEELLPEFAELIDNSGADFVEIKAYMHIGMSRKRLMEENMPSHGEIAVFSKKLLKKLKKFKFEDECDISRIVLLKNKKSGHSSKIA